MRSAAVPGFPEYRIDINAQVYRVVGDRLERRKSSRGNHGYMVHGFWRNNKGTTFYVHRLMLDAFIGPAGEGQEALHANGDPIDNRLENLSWGTRSQNVADAIKHGTATIGSKNGAAKLKAQDIPTIVRMRAKGIRAEEIATRFEVCPQTIRRVLSGQTYKQEMQHGI